MDQRKWEKVIAVSGNQAATWSSGDIETWVEVGALITLDLTTRAAAETITVSLDAKDLASGKYTQIAVFTATGATGTYVKSIYPGGTQGVTGNYEHLNRELPRTWRLTFTHSGSGTHVYSVGLQTLL